MKTSAPRTEQEHIRELVDALAQVTSISAAFARGYRVDYYALCGDFTTQLRRASAEAVALGFYRNQRGWNQIGALLDEAAKRPPSSKDWPNVSELLSSLADKAVHLANRGLH